MSWHQALIDAVVAAALIYLNAGGKKRGQKLEEIHILVNSKMTAALEEIEVLKRELAALKR